MDKIIKSYAAVDVEVNAGKREIVAIISNDSIDRDGDVVLPRGLMKKNYTANPVVMWNHQLSEPPLGKCLWVKATDREIIAKYTITDKSPRGELVFQMLQDKTLNCHSIGFILHENSPPTDKEIKSRPDWAGCRNMIRRFDMYEFSVTPVPANPNAVSLAVSKGLSVDSLKILGPDWEAAVKSFNKVCWSDWEPLVLKAKSVESFSVGEGLKSITDAELEHVKPIVAAKQIPSYPVPKYVRPVSEITKRLLSEMKADQLTAEELLQKLKGRV